MITTTTLQLVVLALGVTSMLLLIVVAPPPPPPPPLPPASSCADELVLFSPCLPYVLSPPNNLSNTASDSSCDAFSSALNSNNGVCLCYLVRQPSILRFPVNNTRVLSLSSVCPIGEDNNSSIKIGSLESLCSGSPALPPLRSTTISGHTNPSGSGPNDVKSPSHPRSPQQNSSLEPARISSATATKQLRSPSFSCGWFSVVFLLVIYFVHQYPLNLATYIAILFFLLKALNWGHKPYLDRSLCSLIRQGALVVTRNMVYSLKFSNPFIAVPNAGASPPQVPERLSTKQSSPPDYANTPPPTQQNSSLEPARISSATTTKQLCSSYSWFAPGIVIFLVPISIHLYSSCNLYLAKVLL
ncbi:hypothetical protein SO802_027650 [Lithocarpus litseifolius]|uniref:Bifunctional inhibitor/plant lipid transfer protein/seed storage helical domain-containing protein n=1 Tax=Lithocarpus litseifolius TaxID=425828 RepID=A0AAW2C6H1_9ROSI